MSIELNSVVYRSSQLGCPYGSNLEDHAQLEEAEYRLDLAQILLCHGVICEALPYHTLGYFSLGAVSSLTLCSKLAAKLQRAKLIARYPVLAIADGGKDRGYDKKGFER